MRICLMAATELELNPFQVYDFNTHHQIELHAHGVGMPIAAYSICKIAFSKPDIMIQCGIAGSFNKQLQIGQTVVVEKDTFEDIGAEDVHANLDLFELGFIKKNEFPFQDTWLRNHHLTTIDGLQSVSSISVNMSSGRQATIDERTKKFGADIETMEGAILHYICLLEKIKFIQFRSISNYIEPRNKNNWQIESAIDSYVKQVCRYIESLP